jgi:DNA invertase Pin-like site-specific DNA recombinase
MPDRRELYRSPNGDKIDTEAGVSPKKASRFISYYRVSTERQGRSGLGLEAQRRAVLDFIDGGAELVAEFTEVESGKRNDRLQLARALEACRKQKPRLVIAKLDRLSRNVAFIAALMESGVEFVAVDMPTANRLTVHILAAVAEHERSMISERTKVALAAAKRRGVKLGNPRLAAAAGKGAAAMKASAQQIAANVLPVIREIQAAGVSTHDGIAGKLNDRKVATARGGRWSHKQVSAILGRSPA